MEQVPRKDQKVRKTDGVVVKEERVEKEQEEKLEEKKANANKDPGR